MIPVVTPAEMGAIDLAAPEPFDVLVARAGFAVARHALAMLGGGYGRRVLVVAGKGGNGADGRVAAGQLTRRGVRCRVIEPGQAVDRRLAAESDLVIDAAYGTGFTPRSGWRPPALTGARVLAVDIPSGVDGLTGAVPDPSRDSDGIAAAERTVTFAALKPGLLLHPGRALAGRVEVVDIGLDVSRARAHLVEAADVAAWLPSRDASAHKWRAACWVVAGSVGMVGAAVLATRGVQRAGAGYVRLSVPGGDAPQAPVEVVQVAVPATGWAGEVIEGAGRFRSLVVGPGLGRDPATAVDVRRLLAGARLPVVVDGDALHVLAGDTVPAPDGAPRVLTPHDGEFEQLTGHAPGPDRFDAARALAVATGAVVLLKGPTTIVADPAGEVLVVTEGPATLATAGTGDVLSGVIGALLAVGVAPLQAAAAGAFLHGRAARLGPRRGLIAGDVADHLAEAADSLTGPLPPPVP